MKYLGVYILMPIIDCQCQIDLFLYSIYI